MHVPAAVIGGGPAGLMAAEQLAAAGVPVAVFDAMPSVGRKFLRAGIGGLNITHSEAAPQLRQRFYGDSTQLDSWLSCFSRDALLAWCEELGVQTFVGSSGRVFPLEKKAAPLLRRWLSRLRSQGVTLYTRHRWLGWADQGAGDTLSDTRHQLLMQTPAGPMTLCADVVVFALGGGSWPRLGADAKWLPLFVQRGLQCTPLQASNGGVEYAWPAAFRREQAGQALKNIVLTVARSDEDGRDWQRRGEVMISAYGLEGSLIYAASRSIRLALARQGSAQIYWDLLPDRSLAELQAQLAARRSKDSLSSFLRKQWRLTGSKLALLKALTSRAQMTDVAQLPGLVKALPQTLQTLRPIEEAISTAGGLALNNFDSRLMHNRQPGLFCAGEMLDWDAPTGGYLLTGCFASGVVAGQGALAYLRDSGSGSEFGLATAPL